MQWGVLPTVPRKPRERFLTAASHSQTVRFKVVYPTLQAAQREIADDVMEKVVRIWECELRFPGSCIRRILEKLRVERSNLTEVICVPRLCPAKSLYEMRHLRHGIRF